MHVQLRIPVAKKYAQMSCDIVHESEWAREGERERARERERETETETEAETEAQRRDRGRGREREKKHIDVRKKDSCACRMRVCPNLVVQQLLVSSLPTPCRSGSNTMNAVPLPASPNKDRCPVCSTEVRLDFSMFTHLKEATGSCVHVDSSYREHASVVVLRLSCPE